MQYTPSTRRKAEGIRLTGKNNMTFCIRVPYAVRRAPLRRGIYFSSDNDTVLIHKILKQFTRRCPGGTSNMNNICSRESDCRET
jgi:hypothetical protein